MTTALLTMLQLLQAKWRQFDRFIPRGENGYRIDNR